MLDGDPRILDYSYHSSKQITANEKIVAEAMASFDSELEEILESEAALV